MTNIEQRTRYIEECAIMAAHPECETLEEAKRIDFISGCRLITGNSFTETHRLRVYKGEETFEEKRYDGHTGLWLQLDEKSSCSIVEILGLPCTLDRVLNALGEDFLCSANGGFYEFHSSRNDVSIMPCYCKWKLLNSNGTSATIHDQSDETIIALSDLLGYKE